MRDSLRKLPAPGERFSAKKVGRGFEMKATRDRGRRSARGASPPAQQEQRKKSSEPVVDRTSSRKRTRGGGLTHHQRGASSSRSFLDPSFSRSPTNRKRGRPTIEDKLAASATTRTGRDKATGAGAGAAARPSSSPRKKRVQRRAGGLSGAPRSSSPRIGEARASSRAAAVSSSVSRAAESEAPAPAATPAAVDVPQPWPFQVQQPQRQTRKRPVDPDKPMKVFIGEDSSSSSGGGGGGGGGSVSSASNSSRAKNTSSEYRQAVQTLDAFAHGKNGCDDASTAANDSSRGGGASSRPNGSATSSSSRRHGARSRSGGARARDGAVSPGKASASKTAQSTTQQAPKATVSGGGGPPAPESSAKDNVICPQFRLHNLFGNSAAAGSGEGEGGRNSGAASSIGSRRRRPVKTAAYGASGAGSMAPPRRGASTRGGGRDMGYLEQTKDALVRSTQAVLGSDYDMDDEDSAFLEQINSGGSGAGAASPRGGVSTKGGGGRSGGKGGFISADLFEAMIERLERQESRARDVSFLCSTSEMLACFFFGVLILGIIFHLRAEGAS